MGFLFPNSVLHLGIKYILVKAYIENVKINSIDITKNKTKTKLNNFINR